MQKESSILFDVERDTVIMLLSSGSLHPFGTRLQFLYHCWEQLHPLIRPRLNEYVSWYMPAEFLPFYKSLDQAFRLWDHTQDVDGAPGWDSKEALEQLRNTAFEANLGIFLQTTHILWEQFTQDVILKDPSVKRIHKAMMRAERYKGLNFIVEGENEDQGKSTQQSNTSANKERKQEDSTQPQSVEPSTSSTMEENWDNELHPFDKV